MVSLADRHAAKLTLEPRASKAWVDEAAATLWVELLDGRTLGVPIAYFPTIADAPATDRAAVAIEADGYALRWERLDEDIAVPHLLGLSY
jgi:hypothetical protein